MGTTYFATVKKSTLKYVTDDGEYMKLNVKSIKGVNIPNSFNIPYVRGIVGLFNAIISRMMYFTEYDSSNNKRPYPKPQDKIYFPAWQIAPMINRCESQSYNIIRSLERILDIHVSRAHEKHGANTFRLSQRVYEFLHIYTLGKLNDFIEKYEIASEDQYALRQLYNYRVVRPTDANLKANDMKEFSSFIKSRKHRNFLHFCAQNNVTNQSRVLEIELNLDLLSNKQREQLSRIKKFLADGVTKLGNYFHWKLVDIQQYITLMLKKEEIKASKPIKKNKSLTTSESNVKENTAHASATRVAQRIPVSEPEPSDIINIVGSWNNMSRSTELIPHVDVIDKKLYNAISNQVKSYGKETILSSINKVLGLNSVSNESFQMTLSKFMTKKTIDIIESSHILEDFESDWLADYIAEQQGIEIIDRVDLENIPTFNSIPEAINWWNNSRNS